MKMKINKNVSTNSAKFLFLKDISLPSYKKIYLHTNNTASTYISGVIFFVFPQIRLITT